MILSLGDHLLQLCWCSMLGRTGGRAVTQRELYLQSNMRKSKRWPLMLPAKLSIFAEIFQPLCRGLREVSPLVIATFHWKRRLSHPASRCWASIAFCFCLFNLKVYRTTTPERGGRTPAFTPSSLCLWCNRSHIITRWDTQTWQTPLWVQYPETYECPRGLFCYDFCCRQ